MKKFAIILAGAMCLTSPVFANDDVREQESDLNSAKRMVHEDNATIHKYKHYRARNRAEKEQAKERGEYGRQAAESATIGANDVAIGANKAKRKMDQKLVEKNRRELNEARDRDRYDEDRDRYGYRRDQDMYGRNREMEPSAGGRRSTFFGFQSTPEYPQGYNNPQEARENSGNYNRNY